jgi:hypothetical protein
VKRKTLTCLFTGIFLLLSFTASTCEPPVTNYYYTNSNNTVHNHYGNSPVTGQPTITPDFINKMLCTYGNPETCNTGQSLYTTGQQFGIDPVYALAFFWHESNFGKYGVAKTNRGLGNIRCTAGYSCNNGFRSYSS